MPLPMACEGSAHRPIRSVERAGQVGAGVSFARPASQPTGGAGGGSAASEGGNVNT